ncbi:hypothetical protein D1822_15125 [Phaeobacter inhibens]|uniref:3'-5' exonuclease n=1 Tax=Phaeobacter inhibens TaxID=221822 RepID=UPI0001632EC3|nr:hypothetical protein [Phaeobacter inhibens]AFO92729.1 hypothetical protein PGA1_c30780 [Phaeobacter inhibens DSM 17395]AUQ47433.1 hypothetical protein PhaeoP10_03127 [Phaeobacter inhibens]AXT24036.1 hypothetical protein D1822_15125 [Phaeobacter inhibens]
MKRSADIENYATLDFEASSLSEASWPIEIGVSWLKDGELQTWSSLIQPAPDWEISDWSTHSAAVHGISIKTLFSAPTAPAAVHALFDNLTGKVLVSDAPEFEARWLSRLLNATGHTQVPKIQDYHELSAKYFSGYALDMLYESLARTPAPHRAGPDSARLAKAWHKALQY